MMTARVAHDEHTPVVDERTRSWGRTFCKGTFLVSAYWHGIHPGYYLFFAGVALMVMIEQLVRAAAATLPPNMAALMHSRAARVVSKCILILSCTGMHICQMQSW